MGKVLVTARIENLHDLYGVRGGWIAEADVRRVEVTDALADRRASGLLMPMRLIHHLGLEQVQTRMVRTADGEIPIIAYWAVRLSIQGRECSMDVSAIADDRPVIIGRMPLDAMDWVIDGEGQRLIGNPEHGGEEMVDIFFARRHGDCPSSDLHDNLRPLLS